MEQPTYYHIHSPQVVHETISGETVIVNLLNGNYYNLRGSGALIWQLIDSGASYQQIGHCLGQSYRADPLTIQSGLDKFIQMLETEGLVAASINQQKSFSMEDFKPPSDQADFEAPVSELEIFSDMQNLLLIDPVHEVNDQGWPHQNPAAGEPDASRLG